MPQSIKLHKSHKKHRWFILVIAIVVSIIAILVFFNNYVNPIILSVSESKVRTLATKSISGAVQSVLANTSNVYDQFIDITTDSEGNISLIQTKSALINRFSKEIGKTAQQNIELMGSEGIGIALGTLTGISIFVGMGPELNFKVSPISSINSSFSSEFVSAGINQTNHKIYLNMLTSVSLILPTANKVVNVNSSILVCESILIGKVPATYLNSSSLDEMLNLIPN